VKNFSNWEFPSTNLLEKWDSQIQADPNEIRTKEIEIQEKLLQFGIAVTME